MIIEGIWFLMILLTGTVIDIRNKKLSLIYLSLCSLGSVMLAFWGRGESWTAKLGGVAFGGILLLTAHWTEGQIGIADAIMVMLLGSVYGGVQVIRIVLISLFFAAMVSICLIALCKADRKSTIPFYPFLLSGFLCNEALVYLFRTP